MLSEQTNCTRDSTAARGEARRRCSTRAPRTTSTDFATHQAAKKVIGEALEKLTPAETDCGKAEEASR